MLKSRDDMEVIHWARQIMSQHGLIQRGWTFKINNRFTRRLGCCTYSKKLIELAGDHIRCDSYDCILDTLLHEIAHALVGAGEGHNKVWQNMAIRIGAKPTSKKSRKVSTDLNIDIPAVFLTRSDGSREYMGSVSEKYYKDVLSGKKSEKNLYIPGRKFETLGRLTLCMINSKELAS